MRYGNKATKFMKIQKEDHLKKVSCRIEGTYLTATIWIDDSYPDMCYLIQNKCNGGYPDSTDEWKKYGKYSWIVQNIDNPLVNNVTYITTFNQIHEVW